MIEQFMLAANEGVATLLTEKGIPCVYRVHEAPPEEKLEAFCTYLKSLGLSTGAIYNDKKTAAPLCGVLKAAQERGISVSVSYSMLRAMAKATYSEIRQPHFGLGIENYCHFTSPIRRLSDLATHRIIHKVLLEGKPQKNYAAYAKRAAAAATDGELRAVSAERRIENLYKVIYMADKIGECFTATITSTAQFGIFAMLDNTCEGLIPISELGQDFFFDEKTLSVRRGLTSYRIGDVITVKVEEADVIRAKIRFSLINDSNI
jgi:ribonuclease R